MAFKEKLLAYYRSLEVPENRLEKYHKITEENAKNLWYNIQDTEKNIRIYRDGAFVGYAENEGKAIKSAFC